MTFDLMPNAAPARAWLRTAGPAALIAVPFLFPFTGGPSANVWQLLASWGCAALLLVAGPVALPARRVMAGLVLTTLLIALSPGANVEGRLAACGALTVIGLAAAVGAGWARSIRSALGSAGIDAGGPDRSGRVFAWGLLAAGLVSAVLGLLQYYQLAAPLVPWTTTPELGQAYGNLRQRNQFATLISMALMASLWLYAARGGPSAAGVHIGQGARTWALAWGGAVVLLLLAAAASTSRTGLLQWLAIVGVAAWMAWRQRRSVRVPARASAVPQPRHSAPSPPCASGRPGQSTAWHLPHPLLLLTLVPAYFVAAWVLPLLAGPDIEDMLRRLREGAPEGHSRVLLWRNVAALIADHPWRGWGWGELSFAHYSHFYVEPRFVEILDNAHNLPLHLAVELGVPAALLIVGGLTWLVLAARPWRERDATRLLAWGVLGAIGLHSLLEYPLWYGPFQLTFGLCLGWLWPGTGRETRGRAGTFTALPILRGAPSLRHASTLPAVLALALMGVVGYAAWDYTRISQIYLSADQRLPGYRDDTLAKLQGSWLYASSVRFAGLTLMPVTPDEAPAVHALAERSLHFSPESRVVIPLIESAHLMGQDAEAATQAERFKRAFPTEYAQWAEGKAWVQGLDPIP